MKVRRRGGGVGKIADKVFMALFFGPVNFYNNGSMQTSIVGSEKEPNLLLHNLKRNFEVAFANRCWKISKDNDKKPQFEENTVINCK